MFNVKKKEIMPEIRITINKRIKIFGERFPNISFIATVAPVRVLEIA